MELYEALLSRRSIGIVKEDPVRKEIIERILQVGTFAPNHFRTEPWRFFVLEGDARKRLGDVFEEITTLELEDITTEESKKKLEKVKQNPLRAPVIIAVAVEPQLKKNVIEIEEYASVHAAVQNMLLAAHDLGLGAIWRTGALCYHEKTKEFFHLSSNSQLVGFIYIGYPSKNLPKAKKTSFEHKTTWLN
ncbi:nitroreductase family protein [Halalkalibacter akibai]|uniref:Putative NAD(P)H nitroreductase n=1 Tax=Halalkalibacter akibai (strain ATCC 43226 / DSM 21942 / CIP 109018 / JCM 9157 / 1139) TaxID=1236973 RepID=W4QVM1_HALA3|nr:nitroreductase [Halalkalibacter akibai]GAE36146.1 nitroreductase [Halalkalibacter akibai JCM 9157]